MLGWDGGISAEASSAYSRNKILSALFRFVRYAEPLGLLFYKSNRGLGSATASLNKKPTKWSDFYLAGAGGCVSGR